jgi:regulator of sigma E protease
MNIVTILEFVGALMALIIVHELGHFLAARLFKVEVEEFGLGIPPRLATLFEARGTKYTLNWLPFGGFVRLKGENDPNIPGSFAGSKPWVRIAVLVAGPLANLAVGIALYAIILGTVGIADPSKVIVTQVDANSPAAQANLMVGDLLLKVNEMDVTSTQVLRDEVYENLGVLITITYQRGEAVETVNLTPRTDPPPGQGAIGIGMGNLTRQISALEAIPLGVVATYEHGRALFGFVGDLIVGQVAPEEGRLVGFKGMYDLYEDTRESQPVEGIPTAVNAMFFFTNITISLGLLNLLPIPALDGGRILFVLPEIILRRRIPPERENVINLIGFALLLFLLIYINLQDFINPVQMP